MTARLWYLAARVARLATPGQWGARGVVLLAPVLVVLAGVLAGARPGWAVVAALVAGGGLAAVQPESHATGLTLFGLVFFWWWVVPASAGAPVLLAAAAVAGMHAAAALAACGPATVVLEDRLVRRWAGRGVLLWSVALVAWLAGRLSSPGGAPGGVPGGVVALSALVVLAAGAWWAAVRFGPGTAPGGS